MILPLIALEIVLGQPQCPIQSLDYLLPGSVEVGLPDSKGTSTAFPYVCVMGSIVALFPELRLHSMGINDWIAVPIISIKLHYQPNRGYIGINNKPLEEMLRNEGDTKFSQHGISSNLQLGGFPASLGTRPRAEPPTSQYGRWRLPKLITTTKADRKLATSTSGTGAFSRAVEPTFSIGASAMRIPTSHTDDIWGSQADASTMLATESFVARFQFGWAAFTSASMGIATTFSSHDRYNPNTKLACWRTLDRGHAKELNDKKDMVVAHRTLPCGSEIVVCNLRTGLCARALVGDRGPFGRFKTGRKKRKYISMLDLAPALSRRIGFNGYEQVLFWVARLPRGVI